MRQEDEKYMRRALQLSVLGSGNVSPNPMVGAVIVCEDKIIGEGWHRQYGSGHAEVNAIASVKDKELLRRSTMYVTLEPCSHYGKTPPCAKLLIENKLSRVVVATTDPFVKVSGRGIKMLREAGIEVEVGLLEKEARLINRRFFTAHTLKRPFVTIKWAQSADGYMDCIRKADGVPARFSTALTTLAVHKLRSLNDGIITTAATIMADNPRMNVRGWSGDSPVKIIIDRKGVLSGDKKIFESANKKILLFTSRPAVLDEVETVKIDEDCPFNTILEMLYDKGITSVLVESGPTFLQSLIDNNLWDEARIETTPFSLGDKGASRSPLLPPTAFCYKKFTDDGNQIAIYLR